MPDMRTPEDVVLRIMAAHWDMASCRCWVCEVGRASGLGPRDEWLSHKNENREKYHVPTGFNVDG